MELESCRICKRLLEFDTVKIGSKGLKNLISVSDMRKDRLFTDIDASANLTLHTKCRALYINSKCVAAYVKKKDTARCSSQKSNAASLKKKGTVPCTSVLATYIKVKKFSTLFKKKDKIPFTPQDSDQPINFQKQCFFCMQDASEDFITTQKKKPMDKRIVVSKVMFEKTKDSVIQTSFKYDDTWSHQVRERIQCVDLVALNGRYHKSCFSKFSMERPTGQMRGRPRQEGHRRQPDLIKYEDGTNAGFNESPLSTRLDYYF